MSESFASILEVGGRSNSLGRTAEVVKSVLNDQSRLEELYQCLLVDEAWYRMRAVDALEKVCRVHPEWLESYVDRFFYEVVTSNQPSIQWHLAQMFTEIKLSSTQRLRAVSWLENQLQTTDVDWIVAANCMKALLYFVQRGEYQAEQLTHLLGIQQGHHSKTVVRQATKLLAQIT